MKKQFPKSRLAGLENLEDRRVLAANVLATGVSSISAGATQDVTLTVATPDATAGSEAVLGIEVAAGSGSSLDPAALTILDSSGAAVSTSFSDANSDGTSSQATVSLPAGVYTLQVSGENGSSGGYQIDVSLLGDVNGTAGSVSTSELQTAQVAFAQSFGTGNFVTDLFNQVHGIDGSGTIDTGFDSNGDGSLDADELALIRQNGLLGAVNVDIEVDGDGPQITNARLVNDTGRSSIDGITTNPDVLVDIDDNSPITALSASVNGGAFVDLTPLVGDFNSTGSFLLEDADLTAINGGTPLVGAIHSLNFNATDELGNVTSNVPFDFTLIRTNQNPTSTGLPDTTATEDSAFSLNVASSFDDSNAGDVLTFSATGMPSWLSLNETTGLLTGTPRNADVGDLTINVIATDSQGFIATEPFQLTVINVNDAPVLDSAIGTQNADEDDPFTLNLNSFFSDEDGDSLTYAVLQATGFDSDGNFVNGAQLPAWLTESNGVLSGTPSDGDGGTFTIGVIAVDASGEQANDLFTLNVTDLNDAPTLVSTIPNQSATEDAAFAFSTNTFFNDSDPGDTLTFTANGLPPSLTINSGGVISGTPVDADVGMSNITILATDTFGTSASGSFVLTIANVNDTPVASDASFVVDPTEPNGSTVGTVDVTDDDVSDTLSYAITGGDATGIYAINSTGLITVADTSQLVEGDSQTLTVQVTDGAGATDTATISISVTSNFAPTAVDDTGFSTGETTPLTILGSDLVANDTDPDGDTLVVGSVEALSAMGATVTLSGGNVTYDATTSSSLINLGDGDSATDTFTYTVSDGNGGTDTATVQVVVNGEHLVEYRLEVLDSSGNVTTSVAAGDTFTLVSYTQDQRTDPEGAFAAFLDVNYVGPATVSGNIVHSTTFPTAVFGDNAIAGILDDVGGLSSGIVPTGGGEMEVFRQSFTAGPTAGVVTFTGADPGDQGQHGTLLFGIDDPIPVAQIEFGTTSVTVTTPAAAAGIVFNPSDVNGDGVVSPVDALLVINALNGTSSGGATDVNGDGVLSPVDALLVINNLFLGSASGGDVLTGSDSDVSEEDLANALEVVFENLADDLQADPDATAALLTELDSPLIDSIYDVIDADESEQETLWDSLADELASLLTSN